MSFLDDLMKEMGGPVAEQLGRREGLSEGQAKGLLESLGPIILGGLKKQREAGVDVEDLVSGLGVDEGGVDDLGGFFDGPPAIPSGDGGLFGGEEKVREASDAVGKRVGVESGMVQKLLPMLVPLVLAFLMRKGRQDGGTPDRKSGMGAILDRDGDGKILDDLAGMVLASQAGRGGKRGFLAMLLSFFTRR